MEIKIGDVIKFDRKDSFFSWIGSVVKVSEKSVVVKYADSDYFVSTERVKKNMIVSVF